MSSADKVMLFDLQRTSFVDGPGIRTTAFFKGCNLRCAWCHNPEGISARRQMLFYQNKCTGCGQCDRCVKLCPTGARKICGVEYDVETLLDIVRADKPFYDSSGGGVTCSGGECMLQIDFLADFLHRCKQDGIHTAVDTAGHVPYTYFERILPNTDLFLYDVKALDAELHRRLTGADNTLILSNLEKLAACCPDKLLARVPMIPDANAHETDGITAYLAARGITAKLLSYHAMGEGKAAALAAAAPRGGK